MCAHFRSTAQGIQTRGKTARFRLRRVDELVYRLFPTLWLDSQAASSSSSSSSTSTSTSTSTSSSSCSKRTIPPMYVDVGFGYTPVTTLESAVTFRRYARRDDLQVLGVEIENERVREAQAFADEHTFFRKGGFNIPVDARNERVRLIRCANVLRQGYDEAQVRHLHCLMGQHLERGGVLVECTSNPHGQVWVANVLVKRSIASCDATLIHAITPPQCHKYAACDRADELVPEYLVFSTNFRGAERVSPSSFQSVLPKNLIHRTHADKDAFATFLEHWRISFDEAQPIGAMYGVRAQFHAAAHALAERGYDIVLTKRLLRRGFLVWRLSTPETVALMYADPKQCQVRNNKM